MNSRGENGKVVIKFYEELMAYHADSSSSYIKLHELPTHKETMMSQQTTKNGKPEELRKVDFAYTGDKLIIPEDMDLDKAKLAIERQIEEENVNVSISEPIDSFPLDGAVALMRVLKRRYGWTHLIPTPGFFGPSPPSMIGVEVGPNERIQVPWGTMTVPNIDGKITTSCRFENGMPCFMLTGNVKRKHERTVSQIANEIREEVKKNSIYREKTIKINFRDSDGVRKDFERNYDYSLCPKFIEIDKVGDTQPIFSKTVEDAIRINIHTPIKFSSRCRKKGASLKKGVLLGGPFGTGKTLTAFDTAKICQEKGWTFLYLEDVRDLDLAIGFAKLYMPCCLFAEDVDRVAAGPRTAEMDKLLNTIDGVESKNPDDKLLIVLTTNHLGAINPAFLRPGRIDAVINVTPPDATACLRIVKKYIAEGDCKTSGTDEDLTAAIKCLVGANAAFFRTTVEQAKLAAIENMADDDSELIIGPAELAAVAQGMVPHCKLINPEHGDKNLLDMSEEIDPMNMAFEILMAKLTEGFINNITNPKVLKGIVVKTRKSRGNPSNN